jgi:hypothetical protein
MCGRSRRISRASRSPSSARELGLDERKIIKLASNENPRGVGPRTRAAIEGAFADIARYPDGNGYELKLALSKRYGVDMAQIVLGNGSNDVLELVALAFLGPGLSAVYSQHAFAVYALATQARGARAIVVPAREFGHDVEAMAGRDRRRHPGRVARQSEQSDRDHGARRSPRSVRAARARARHHRDRRGVQRVPAREPARADGRVAEEASEPDPDADVLEGVRARRGCASATRSRTLRSPT